MARVNLVDMAQEAILSMIVSKEYDANGFLPSEGDMAVTVGVSRATLREAVRSLEMRGFVKRIHGKGVQVADDSVGVITRSLEDLMAKNANAQEDLMEVRMMLEPGGAALAARRRTPADLKVLEKNILIMEGSTDMDGKYHLADLTFHLDLAKATGNQMYISYMSANITVLQEMIANSAGSDCSFEQKHRYHRNIFEAVKVQDEQRASDAMLIHLQATQRNRKKRERNQGVQGISNK